MKGLSKLKNKFANNNRGQSLVEMAIITPILILLFMGVFEVGWALRGYLVLANVNRETVRFAVKSGVLDYSDPHKDVTQVGYDVVLSHTLSALGYNTGAPLNDPNQRPALPLLFDAGNSNAAIIMSHFVIDTGFPCVRKNAGQPVVPYEFDPTCNCTNNDLNDAQWFTRDDLVAYPGHPRFPHYGITYGLTTTTRLGNGSYETLAKELALENNQFNCNILKNGGLPTDMSINNLIVAETFYEQPQLLGVPLVSNPLTDPIPFYTHTAMRIVSSRSSDNSDSIGPVCELLPLALAESDLDNPGGLPVPPQQNLDITQSGGKAFNWLFWDSLSAAGSTVYVAEALENPRLPMFEFVADSSDPEGTTDKYFDVNDRVRIATGVETTRGNANSDKIDTLLEKYEGQAVHLPVQNQIANGAARISHIARVTINNTCLPKDNCMAGNRRLAITFETYVDNVCD